MERWDKGRWDECLRKNRLLVGTPEVFRRALDQGDLADDSSYNFDESFGDI